MRNEEPLGPVEKSLRRSFSPPDLSALQAAIDEAARKHAPPADELAPRRRRFALVAAAALAAAAVLLVWLWPANQNESIDVDPRMANLSPRQQFGANLSTFVSERSLPPPPGAMSCGAVRQPPASCTDHSAKPKPWLPAIPRLEVLGECGADDVPTCQSSGLLAVVGLQLRERETGTRILVCMDLAASDPRPLLPKDSGLRLFRRNLGAYVIYEITPLSAPRTLNLFRL